MSFRERSESTHWCLHAERCRASRKASSVWWWQGEGQETDTHPEQGAHSDGKISWDGGVGVGGAWKRDTQEDANPPRVWQKQTTCVRCHNGEKQTLLRRNANDNKWWADRAERVTPGGKWAESRITWVWDTPRWSPGFSSWSSRGLSAPWQRCRFPASGPATASREGKINQKIVFIRNKRWQKKTTTISSSTKNMQSTSPEWFSFILASRESCLKSMPACLFKVPLPKTKKDKLA